MAGDDDGSWLESRRLIISQLKTMDDSIRSLSDRIDKHSESNRERVNVFNTEANQAISDLRVRIAMLEVSAKIWGGIVGMLSGSIASLILDLSVGHIVK